MCHNQFLTINNLGTPLYSGLLSALLAFHQSITQFSSLRNSSGRCLLFPTSVFDFGGALDRYRFSNPSLSSSSSLLLLSSSFFFNRLNFLWLSSSYRSVFSVLRMGNYFHTLNSYSRSLILMQIITHSNFVYTKDTQILFQKQNKNI